MQDAIDMAPPWDATPGRALPALPTLDDNHRDGIPHNLIAHPLLILCPPLGRWLHDRTQPTVPRRFRR
jgi:hypothetical protein